MHKKQMLALAFILGLPFLGGCGKTLQYEPKKLTHLNVVTADSWQEKEEIRVLIKKFDTQLNQYYFNQSKLKTIVLQLTIQNNTDNEWVLTDESINLELASLDTIKKDMSPSFGRSFGMQLMFGDVMGSAYAFKQYETKQRIAKDLGQKCLERALTIPAHKKRSTLLFVYPKNLKKRCNIQLFNADIPNKNIEISLHI